MIEATGLTKRYGKTLAVNNLSFSVAAGQVTGFLGPNGAGKSTTMRMILGLDNPTGGRSPSGARSTTSSRNRCAPSARCSTRSGCTPTARRAPTCSGWRSPTASR
jgi:ABC-type uncharacterized transport system ATPase subunit